jgi:hypothetical protein
MYWLASLLKVFLIISLFFFLIPVRAEYYLVYSSDCCCNTERYVKKTYKKTCYKKSSVKKVKYKKPRHYVAHKPRSSYHISVYYVWNGFPNNCPSPCEARYRCCGGYQKSSGSIVQFSGAPAAWPRDDFSEGDNNWNYYQDRATADDVYPDMNIDN